MEVNFDVGVGELLYESLIIKKRSNNLNKVKLLNFTESLNALFSCSSLCFLILLFDNFMFISVQ